MLVRRSRILLAGAGLPKFLGAGDFGSVAAASAGGADPRQGLSGRRPRPAIFSGAPPPPSGLRARFSHSVVDHMRIPDAGPPAHTQGRFRASLSAWRSGRHAHCRRHTHNLGPWPGRVVASIRRTLGACLRQAALLRDWLGIAQRWLGSDGCCPELPATRGGSDSRNAHRSMLPRVTLTVLRLQSCSDLAPGTCHSRALPTCRPCVAYVPTADLPRKLSDFGRHWRQN